MQARKLDIGLAQPAKLQRAEKMPRRVCRPTGAPIGFAKIEVNSGIVGIELGQKLEPDQQRIGAVKPGQNLGLERKRGAPGFASRQKERPFRWGDGFGRPILRRQSSGETDQNPGVVGRPARGVEQRRHVFGFKQGITLLNRPSRAPPRLWRPKFAPVYMHAKTG